MKIESLNEDILFVRQTLLGNQTAFEKLVIKYRPMIFDLVASYVKNSADAEDLTQEVFLKAYQNLSSLKNLEQFSFWLRRIAQNHCTDWLRQRRENHLSFDGIKVAESMQITPSPEEMALKRELREIVWQAIDSLLEIDRKLMKARYLEDASLKQLQSDYGLSYPAIVNRLKRAKQKVRETVQKLLRGICALPSREVLEKLMLGGFEVVKLSLKTKIITVGVAVALGLGGVGVWHWHSKPAPKPSVAQQEVKPKKSAPVLSTPKIAIPKPAPKAAPQEQPARPHVQAEENQEEISDEEVAQFEQWLAERKQSDEQDEVDKLAKESEAEPEPEWITQARQELAELRPKDREFREKLTASGHYLDEALESDDLPLEIRNELSAQHEALSWQYDALLRRMVELGRMIWEYEKSKQQ